MQSCQPKSSYRKQLPDLLLKRCCQLLLTNIKDHFSLNATSQACNIEAGRSIDPHGIAFKTCLFTLAINDIGNNALRTGPCSVKKGRVIIFCMKTKSSLQICAGCCYQTLAKHQGNIPYHWPQDGQPVLEERDCVQAGSSICTRRRNQVSCRRAVTSRNLAKGKIPMV